MAPTASHGDATRERLLAATTELLVERGWGGVSTRSIAERADVRSGVVHYHFGSIDDLRRAAAMRALNEMIAPFTAAAAELPPRALIAEMGRASVEEYAPDSPEARLIYEVLPAATRDPALQADLRELLAGFRVAMGAAIRRWHPAPLADPEVLAELIGAAVDGLQLHLMADPRLDLGRHLDPLLILLGDEVTP